MNICFVSRINPEHIDQYTQEHNPVWPDMLRALEQAGWENYRLYVSPNGLLVGTATIDSLQSATARMQEYDINEKWQQHMSQFFVAADSPDQTFTELQLVFDLEAQLADLAAPRTNSTEGN